MSGVSTINWQAALLTPGGLDMVLFEGSVPVTEEAPVEFEQALASFVREEGFNSSILARARMQLTRLQEGSSFLAIAREVARELEENRPHFFSSRLPNRLDERKIVQEEFLLAWGEAISIYLMDWSEEAEPNPRSLSTQNRFGSL